MSRRAEQIGSTLHRAVQGVLGEGLSDPRLDGTLVTVTSVRLDDDMSEAVVTVSVLPEPRQDLALHALKDAGSHIRRKAGDRMDLKRMPRIVFKLDRALKKQAEVLGALARLRAEAPPAQATGGENTPGAPTLAGRPDSITPPPSTEDRAR